MARKGWQERRGGEDRKSVYFLAKNGWQKMKKRNDQFVGPLNETLFIFRHPFFAKEHPQ